MPRELLRALFVLLWAMLVGWGLARAETVVIEPRTQHIDLSERLTVLHDPGRRLSRDEVASRPDDFVLAKRKDLVARFNAGAFWLRVSLANAGEQPLTRWLVVGTAKTPQVTLHQRQGDSWQRLQSGRSIALRARPVAAQEPVFPIHLLPGETRDLLVHIDVRGSAVLATALWDPEAYRFAAGEQQMKLAALLGGLLVGGFLALLVFVRLREAQYGWLGLLLLAIAGLEASRENLISTYLWPAALSLPPQALALFAVIALFSLSKVVTHALELPARLPFANRLMLALRWIGVAGAGITLFNYGQGVFVMSLASVLQNLAILLLSLLAWHRGQPNALLFLLAFSLALVTEILRQLANLGLLPWIGAMDFSTFFFLLASPLILFGLAEQTRRLSERLKVAEQLQAAKSAFFARISHELRSPLNTILGYSRMLARGTAKLSLAEGTAGIEKSTLRLLRLIDELLDEARAAAGQLTITPAPLALLPWLEEIARTARIAIEARGNRLSCEFAGELSATIEADGERLRQVLDNLLGNANRHTAQGTITFACAATRHAGALRLDFAVADSGEGIAAEQLQVIFEPFVRGRTPSAGHGLGLSICRELVRQMGSDITVSSTPGQGSRFDFSLSCPLAETIMPASLAGAPSPALPAAHALPPVRPRVLLVDDDEAQIDMLTELLEEAGFEVTTAQDGKTALGRLAQAGWDVVITDQMMPVVDGWQVLQAARAASPAMPVILLSAAPPCRPDTIPAGLRFDAALRKPALSVEVLATVWHQILKVGAGGTALAWESLARLASEGDVSGIEDWIAAGREAAPGHAPVLAWVEGALHRLELALLERFACLAAGTGKDFSAPAGRRPTP